MSSTAIEAITAATDARCHAALCTDSGCSLLMTGVPKPYILLNLESRHSPASVSQPHCDYLFIGGSDTLWIAPIELTTGRKRASRFLAQLAGGASVADMLLPQGIAVQFNPIAVHSGKVDSREILKLRAAAAQVPFRDERAQAQVARCCSTLAGALNT